MKRYKLLKDLPFAKAGDIFRGELEYGETVLFPEEYEHYKHKLSSDEFWDFSEWFEEIKEYYVINPVFGEVLKTKDNSYSDLQIRNMRDLGMLFDTWLEADRKLAYLKAKAIIKQDAKGFKPDWTNNSEIKYFGYLHFEKIEFGIAVKENKFGRERMNKTTTIYFQSEEDIKDSLEKHPEEWRVYLTYEQ